LSERRGGPLAFSIKTPCQEEKTTLPVTSTDFSKLVSVAASSECRKHGSGIWTRFPFGVLRKRSDLEYEWDFFWKSTLVLDFFILQNYLTP